MSEDHRPLPVLDADSEQFWQAAQRHELAVQRCRNCQRAQYYPRVVCRHCSSDQLDWIRSSGRGVVYSLTTSRRAAGPSLAGHVPYVVALVDLEERVRILTNIVGPGAIHTRIGDAVRVTFEDIGEGFMLPVFTRN
jgi:uncharacterized OB-fold protein